MKTRVALSHPKSLLLEACKPPVQGVQQGEILACVVSSVGCWPHPFRLEMWLPLHVLPVVTLLCPLQPPHPMLPLAVTPHPALLRTLRQVGQGRGEAGSAASRSVPWPGRQAPPLMLQAPHGQTAVLCKAHGFFS